MRMPPELKARILASAEREASPTRQVARARTRLVALSALGAALVLFALATLLDSRRPSPPPRPEVFAAATVAGWIAVGLVTTWAAFGRGRSMLGRPRAWLLAIAALTAPTLFGWMFFWNTRYAETMAPYPERSGKYCLAFTLVIAAWPLVALARVRRERDGSHASLAGAARGAALGALGGFLVDVWCPVANPAHVAFGHILPIVLLSAVGAVAGRRYSGVRST